MKPQRDMRPSGFPERGPVAGRPVTRTTFHFERRDYDACTHAEQRMSTAETSVRVSRETLAELDRLRAVFHTRTADETIRRLVRERRSRALNRMLGSGKGTVSQFTEEDRLETHG